LKPKIWQPVLRSCQSGTCCIWSRGCRSMVINACWCCRCSKQDSLVFNFRYGSTK